MMAMRETKLAVKREVRELALLHEISLALGHSMDLREVTGLVLKAFAEQMGMTRGTLTLLDRETGEIFIEAAYGLSDSQKERGRYRLGEGITGKVVASGRPAVVPRISEEPLFLNRTGARRKLRKKDVSFICVPIKLGQEVIGALSADRLFSDQVELDEDVRLLSIIASMIAQAVKLRQQAQEEHRRLLVENQRLQTELKERFRPSNIIGNSKAMQGVYDLIAIVSKSEATVMIRGESGTGKELVAHAIHYNSPRGGQPFIKVNLAALPETVIESELFGHEKGAFTDASTQRKGRFEMAQGGTVFLDEIGDLSPATQIKLLRVIQEREFERVGGNETIRCDVRIITATNRNLEELMESGKFREDLYYRLNVFPIFIPPLRERKTDVSLLADFFVEKYARANHKTVNRISTRAIDMLMSYHWPGNVRELENCIERAVILTTDNVVHAHHLPPSLQTADASSWSDEDSLPARLENIERNLILDALKTHRGNMAKAAHALGVSERIMGLRMKKYNIDFRHFRANS
jgi:Nif-specific regulatory protein